MWVEIKNFDQGGVNSDLPARSLPINAVTDVSNVGFNNGKLAKLLGYTSIYGTPTVAPYHLQHGISSENDAYVIYCGLNDVYSYYNGTHTKITRTLSAYAATKNNDWTSTILGGIAIINEGVNVPQYTTSPTTQFADLPNWPSSWTCQSIRAFREFLVTTNMTEGGTTYAQKLRWSHPADPGSVPASWDETDTTRDAGYKHFSETPGILYDTLPMGGINVVYKSDSAYAMQYIGGQFVFSFTKLFDIGIIGKNAVCEVEGKHVFIGTDDIYIHNGGTPTSLLHRKQREEIFDSIDASYRNRCRVIADRNRQQVWFLLPTDGTGYLSKAHIWNWRDNTWAEMDLPSVTAASVGGEVGSNLSWDSDGDTWDSDNSVWNNTRVAASQVLLSSATNTKLYQGNVTSQFDGVNFTAYAERKGLDFGDPNSIKFVRKVRPHFVGMNDGSKVTVSVGSQETPEGTVSWSDHPFIIGSTNEVWPLVRGRYIAWKVSMSEGAGRTNLAPFSESFDDAAWSTLRSSITPNVTETTAPDGTYTADKFFEDTSVNQTHRVNSASAISIVTRTIYTTSVYVKAAERNEVMLMMSNGAYSSRAMHYFNMTTRTTTTDTLGGAEIIRTGFSDEGNGWYRIWISALFNDTSGSARVNVNTVYNGTNSYTGDGVSGIYIWGAQFEVGDVASNYEPTAYIKTEAVAVNASAVEANDVMELESLEFDVDKNGLY